jgi:hypothetical protein
LRVAGCWRFAASLHPRSNKQQNPQIAQIFADCADDEPGSGTIGAIREICGPMQNPQIAEIFADCADDGAESGAICEICGPDHDLCTLTMSARLNLPGYDP